MPEQQLNPAKRWVKNRRSQRIPLDIAIVVQRPIKEGPQFYETTRTLGVNAHGALVVLRGLVAPRQKLLLQNPSSGEQQECRVVYVDQDPLGPAKVAVEFTRPSPKFWRLAYPPSDWTTNG